MTHEGQWRLGAVTAAIALTLGAIVHLYPQPLPAGPLAGRRPVTVCEHANGHRAFTAKYRLSFDDDSDWTLQHVAIESSANTTALEVRFEGSSSDPRHIDPATLPTTIGNEDFVTAVFTARVRTPGAVAELRGIRVRYSVGMGPSAGQHDDSIAWTFQLAPHRCGPGSAP